MARIGVQVQATEENTQQRDFTNLPNGDYRLEVSANTVNQKNEGTRDHSINLNLTIDVIAPDELKGRKLFVNYNLQHPKPDVQEIGQRQFACLLRALEMQEAPDDADELQFKEFGAKIGMGKDSKNKNADGTPQYPARNEIKKYYYPDEGPLPDPALDVVQPSAARPAAANDNRPAASRPAPAAAAGGAKKNPWSK